MENTLIALPGSANASSAHVNTSDRYKFVNTANLVERFLEMGMTVRQAQEARVRRQDYSGFQRHLIRLATPFNITTDRGDVSNLELLIMNQHIGSSSLIARFGIYRMICLNGLVVGTDLGIAMRIRHFGSRVQDLINAMMERVQLTMPTIAERVSMMTARRMSADESRRFAQDALTVRGVDVNDVKRRSYSVPELLSARREEDRDDNLWNVFNRTQEHLMRGVSGRRGQGLRRITSPTRDVAVNERLWELAEGYLAR
jgi:hypothetical protein